MEVSVHLLCIGSENIYCIGHPASCLDKNNQSVQSLPGSMTAARNPYQCQLNWRCLSAVPFPRVPGKSVPHRQELFSGFPLALKGQIQSFTKAPKPIGRSWRFWVRGSWWSRKGWEGGTRWGWECLTSYLSTALTRWSPPSHGPLAPPQRTRDDPNPDEISWPATCLGVSAVGWRGHTSRWKIKLQCWRLLSKSIYSHTHFLLYLSHVSVSDYLKYFNETK